jgi:hypothetical protein
MCSRDGRGWRMRLSAACAAALALAMAGCSAAYVEDSQATVLLVVSSINKGTTIASDVRGDTSIVNCPVPVTLAVTVKNPNNPGSPVENVILQRYDVSFQRSDGRGVEGVDVPYRFSGALTATVVRGEEASVVVDVVRQQAKLEPPLSNITGLQLVEMTANLTFYGQTVSRQSVSASGSAAIRFADFGTGTTTCESSAGGSGSGS